MGRKVAPASDFVGYVSCRRLNADFFAARVPG